jgi:hypothetical protein
MLLSALGCTIATICIKIVHVVKVLRVRAAQFGEASPVQRNAGYRYDVTRPQHKQQTQQQKRTDNTSSIHRTCIL